MSDANAYLVGALTKDPELKFGNNGNAICKISVAVNRKVKDKETTSYFDCTAFGSVAEHIANSLKKGDRVVVQGTLTQDRWESADGQKRSSISVLVDAIGPDLRFADASPVKTNAQPRVAQAALIDESPF